MKLTLCIVSYEKILKTNFMFHYLNVVISLYCYLLVNVVIVQARILMAMARDGLLPSFFSDIDEHTKVPVKGTIVTGILATALAFCMDVSQLAGMVCSYRKAI